MNNPSLWKGLLMHHVLRLAVAFALAIGLLGAREAQAEFVLRLSTLADAPTTSPLIVPLGQSTTIHVFLEQTLGQTALTDDGLFSFGTRATYNASVGRIDNVTRNTVLFGDFFNTTRTDPPNAFVLGGDRFGNGGATGNFLRLGSFDVELVGTGSLDLRFGDADAGFEDFVLADNDSTSIDADLFSISPISDPTDRSRFFAFDVTAIPEPSSLAVLGLAAIGFAARRRRRITR